ncbi:MAG: hypothetical protein AAF614_21540 [Chloroflexota bacterium]
MQNTILQRSQGIGGLIITAVLWLATAIAAFWEVLLIRNIAVGLYLRYAVTNPNLPQSLIDGQVGLVGLIFVFVGAIVAIAIAIGGAEFHYKNAGQPKSWRLIAYVFVFQIVVFLLSTVV